jgi:hypothetical protein
LARIIYLQHQSQVLDIVKKAKDEERKPPTSKKVIESMEAIGNAGFTGARSVFETALKEYLGREGGNEDAALKNTAFAELVDHNALKKGDHIHEEEETVA